MMNHYTIPGLAHKSAQSLPSSILYTEKIKITWRKYRGKALRLGECIVNESSTWQEGKSRSGTFHSPQKHPI